MDVDARHSLLREKLESLGFTQPLPIGSLAIVSALLDDLIGTTNSLKLAKSEISRLRNEKTAWDLGVEPYKCDNSKLLAECNSLHLEIIQQRDAFQQKIFELNQRLRSVQHENHDLQDRVKRLTEKIDDLEDPKNKKNRNDLLNQKRKPFISTVRGGQFLAPTLKPLGSDNPSADKCACQKSKDDAIDRLRAEQDLNRVKSHLELIELYKSQLESRNREISRLNHLLVGGRPPLALAKDCCYRGVSSLTDDIQELQREKSKVQADYDLARKNEQAAFEQIEQLKEQNEQIVKELNDLKEVALSVENEANSSLSTLHKHNSVLKQKLNEAKKRIHELEAQLYKSNETPRINAKGDAKATSKENPKATSLDMRYLLEKLESASVKETELKLEVEKLNKRIAKLKGKLSMNESFEKTEQQKTNDATTMTSVKSLLNFDSQDDLNRLRTDRDFYKQEYMKLVSNQTGTVELNMLRSQLTEKNYEVKTLLKKLDSVNKSRVTESAMHCSSVEAAMHRLDREKHLLEDAVERLTIERNELRENLRLATAAQQEQKIRDEYEIERLKEKIRELDSEHLKLQMCQAPSKTTISLLKDELNQARTQITELTEENSKLRVTNNQLKTLHDQTESVLHEHQNRLTYSARQLCHAEARLTTIDTSRSQGCREIGELRAEVNRLKTINMQLEADRDKTISDLDVKTEKLFSLQSKLDSAKARIIELESEVLTTNRQLESKTSEMKMGKSALHEATSETDALRRQISQLKRTNDNVMIENRRLTNEVGDMEVANRAIKTKLVESEKEVDKLKNQLQQYVQEVRRAEDLLLRKEEERNEMLDNYRSLSHDAVMLEGSKHSLELEAAESKRNVMDLEERLTQLQVQLRAREKELDESNSRVCELTKQVNQLELDVERYKHERTTARKELEAVRELCNKLENETDKLNAEVNEYADIRRELERENEKHRNELLMAKTGDKAATESLKQLLQSTRKELEDERIARTRSEKEVEMIKTRIGELQEKLSEEHVSTVRQETLAKEYSLQIQELRNQLTDSRFQARASGDHFASM